MERVLFFSSGVPGNLGCELILKYTYRRDMGGFEFVWTGTLVRRCNGAGTVRADAPLANCRSRQVATVEGQICYPAERGFR